MTALKPQPGKKKQRTSAAKAESDHTKQKSLDSQSRLAKARELLDIIKDETRASTSNETREDKSEGSDIKRASSDNVHGLEDASQQPKRPKSQLDEDFILAEAIFKHSRMRLDLSVPPREFSRMSGREKPRCILCFSRLGHRFF